MAMDDVVDTIKDQAPIIMLGLTIAIIVIGGVFLYTKARYGIGQIPPIQAILVGFVGFGLFAYLQQNKKTKTRRW
jgi:hypothetical protein